MAQRRITYSITTHPPVYAQDVKRPSAHKANMRVLAILGIVAAAVIAAAAWYIARDERAIGTMPQPSPRSMAPAPSKEGAPLAPAEPKESVPAPDQPKAEQPKAEQPKAEQPKESAPPAPAEPKGSTPAPDQPKEGAPAEPPKSGLETEEKRSAGTQPGATAPSTPKAPEALPAPPEATVTTQRVRIERGDRLMPVLVEAGIEREEAHAVIRVLRSVFDPRHLRPGQVLELSVEKPANGAVQFVKLQFNTDGGASSVTVERKADGFAATETKKDLKAELVRGQAEIDSSLYVAGLQAGVPASVMVQLINIYSFDVDFQRDIRKGDSFEVMYNNYLDRDGKLVRQGDILYATLTLRGTAYKLYQFTPRSGRTDYFNPKGESVRKALMRTPIDGARLSSGFGARRHPILGYTRMHQGIDFAAPTGTPIYAAGDGTIMKMGWQGGYGRYVLLRHNSTYNTAYAHMSGFGRGLGAGSRVRQGQIIGYVGTTGQSTGPHLHYEVHVKGRAINPLALKLPTGQRLAGKDLFAFQEARAKIDHNFVASAKDVKIASRAEQE